MPPSVVGRTIVVGLSGDSRQAAGASPAKRRRTSTSAAGRTVSLPSKSSAFATSEGSWAGPMRIWYSPACAPLSGERSSWTYVAPSSLDQEDKCVVAVVSRPMAAVRVPVGLADVDHHIALAGQIFDRDFEPPAWLKPDPSSASPGVELTTIWMASVAIPQVRAKTGRSSLASAGVHSDDDARAALRAGEDVLASGTVVVALVGRWG